MNNLLFLSNMNMNYLNMFTNCKQAYDNLCKMNPNLTSLQPSQPSSQNSNLHPSISSSESQKNKISKEKFQDQKKPLYRHNNHNRKNLNYCDNSKNKSFMPIARTNSKENDHLTSNSTFSENKAVPFTAPSKGTSAENIRNDTNQFLCRKRKNLINIKDSDSKFETTTINGCKPQDTTNNRCRINKFSKTMNKEKAISQILNTQHLLDEKNPSNSNNIAHDNKSLPPHDDSFMLQTSNIFNVPNSINKSSFSKKLESLLVSKNTIITPEKAHINNNSSNNKVNNIEHYKQSSSSSEKVSINKQLNCKFHECYESDRSNFLSHMYFTSSLQNNVIIPVLPKILFSSKS